MKSPFLGVELPDFFAGDGIGEPLLRSLLRFDLLRKAAGCGVRPSFLVIVTPEKIGEGIFFPEGNYK